MNRIHVCTPLAGLSHFFAVFETSFRIETTVVFQYEHLYSTGTCPLALWVNRRSVLCTMYHSWRLCAVSCMWQRRNKRRPRLKYDTCIIPSLNFDYRLSFINHATTPIHCNLYQVPLIHPSITLLEAGITQSIIIFEQKPLFDGLLFHTFYITEQ